MRRYLAAFGPAASADLRAWCGLAGLPAAVAAIREELVTFRDERGRELLDLPDAPRPDPDTPAPVRFLPAFDNAILGYHDRSRIIDDAHRGLSVAGARVVLVDGRVAATWTVEAGTVIVTPLRRLSRADRAAVAVGIRLYRCPSPAMCGSVVLGEPARTRSPPVHGAHEVTMSPVPGSPRRRPEPECGTGYHLGHRCLVTTEVPMLRMFLAVTAMALATWTGTTTTAEATATPTPTPSATPTPACPPALPITANVTGATTTSVTIRYSMFFRPPCGYDPPMTVSLFTSLEDAQQGRAGGGGGVRAGAQWRGDHRRSDCRHRVLGAVTASSAKGIRM